MLILLALQIKDGMVLLALILLAHLTPIIMALNVFAQIQEITASHGKSMMEYNVFISQALVQKEPRGMVHIVLPATTVLKDFTLQVQHVHHYLKDVFLHLHGKTDVAKLAKSVHMAHISEAEAAFLIFLAKMVKFGTMI